VETIDTALVAAGGVVLLLGIVGGWMQRHFWVSEPLLCLVLGVAIGPAVTGLIAPEQLPGTVLLRALAGLTLGIAVMEAALRLPTGYIGRMAGTMAIVLLVAMPLAWVTTAGMALLVLGMAPLPALVLGALMSPTDPVLASTIVEGSRAERSLPERIRQLLTAESGANDGVGQLFLMLPVLLLTASPGVALSDWLVGVLCWDIAAAVAIGLILGEVAGRMMAWARRQPDSEGTSSITIGLALTVTVLASVELIGSSSILAVFAAGVRFKFWVASENTLHPDMQASIGRFFTLPFFLVLGALLPWGDWQALGWGGLAFAVGAATLRRLPWFLLLRPLLSPVKAPREAAVLGWFGPIGTAAIYYALLAEGPTGLSLWPLASLTVAVSAVLHGLTAAPAMKLLRAMDNSGTEGETAKGAGRADR
jgi:NhaP-type Na+/H+ or K+/H+ antiporter